MAQPIHHSDIARLLVVEDDVDTLTMSELLLRLEGYTVIGAPDAKTAMARVTDTPIDGVVLNYRLPDSRGMELCEWLRAHLDGTVPIILVTADMTVTLREEAMMAGATVFLAKPFDFVTLFALLTAHGVPASR
jgi:DNA-binding response OmpR family regulator